MRQHGRRDTRRSPFGGAHAGKRQQRHGSKRPPAQQQPGGPQPGKTQRQRQPLRLPWHDEPQRHPGSEGDRQPQRQRLTLRLGKGPPTATQRAQQRCDRHGFNRPDASASQPPSKARHCLFFAPIDPFFATPSVASIGQKSYGRKPARNHRNCKAQGCHALRPVSDRFPAYRRRAHGAVQLPVCPPPWRRIPAADRRYRPCPINRTRHRGNSRWPLLA